jgi:predicted DNA-binding protein with PD1-like motif
MHVIDVRNGEVMETIAKELAGLGIRRAALTFVGGVDSFRISTMPAHDATADIITDYDQPGEMTGTGEVVDGVPHVHAVFGIEGDVARAGHLHAATVSTWFVRAYVHPMP